MSILGRWRVWRARRLLKRMSLTICGQTFGGEEALLAMAPLLSRPGGATERELFACVCEYAASKSLQARVAPADGEVRA
jgi:fermentation-respiration switch protein FrsA (DUF1100 family)